MPDGAGLVDSVDLDIASEFQFQRLERQQAGSGKAPGKCCGDGQTKITKLICGLHIHAAMDVEIHEGDAEVWGDEVGEGIDFLRIGTDSSRELFGNFAQIHKIFCLAMP